MKVTVEVNGIRIQDSVTVDSIKVEADYSEEEYSAALAALLQALQQMDEILSPQNN